LIYMEETIENCLKRTAEIVSGIPLEWGSIPVDQREKAILVALHCALNGPVGVNKDTHFPVVGKGSIKTMFGCSNSSWKGFCRQVSTIVTVKAPNIECSQMRINKRYWPL